ncbi:MAG: efflux RND transporter periplasmic adaptor subunit, partial [Planctomycetota bacterium]
DVGRRYVRLLSLSCVVLGLFLGPWIVGCREPESTEVVRPVRAMVVGDFSVLSKGSLPGRAEAATEVNLAFRVGGPLIARPIRVGQKVEKGELLAKIDPSDFEIELNSEKGALARAEAELAKMEAGARPEEIEQLKAAVASAKAAYERAQKDYERDSQLVASRTISQQDFDLTKQRVQQTEAELRQAEEALAIGLRGARKEDIAAKQAEIMTLSAAVAAAENNLKYCELRAPFSGTITAIYVENFETVQPQQPICRLVDIGHIDFVVDVPESALAVVPYAKELRCKFREIPDKVFPAKVTEIGIEPSPVTRTYPVKLTVDNSEGLIMPGMTGDLYGTVELPDEMAKQGFVVPESALLGDADGNSYVWIVDPEAQTVHKRKVEPRGIATGGIQIVGVQKGEIVVTAGVHVLREGQQVKLPSLESAESEKGDASVDEAEKSDSEPEKEPANSGNS